ncbi:MAG: tetratricopeptide repeat protein [Gemmatimonadaceae bacterium]
MPDVVKLKKKAAELELKKQFDKALAVYVEILDSYEGTDEEVDVALYNRVGDIYLKQGNTADAVDYYEQAVDKYAEGGFFNNAIALCNKILRNSPGRASIYYKLGKISAQKGFISDAKINFLEYADRMQKSGKIDEAFRALKEFADLCPDQDDIRLLLADQLSKQERGQEAIEQLQTLYERYSAQGRELEARATVDRMKAIDPGVKPRTSGAVSSRTNDLIFLDLEERRSRSNAIIAKRATQGLDLIHTGEYQEVAPAEEAQALEPPSPELVDTPAPGPEILDTPIMEPALLDGVTRAGEYEHEDPATQPGPLDGLDTTGYHARDAASPLDSPGMIRDLEPTDMGSSFLPPALRGTPMSAPAQPTSAPQEALLDFTLPEPSDSPVRPSLNDLPLLAPDDIEEPPRAPTPATATDRDEEDEPSIGGDLPFITPDETPTQPAEPPALEDIPLMDLSLPAPGEAMASITGPAADASPTIDFLELEDAAMPERGNEDTVDPAIEQPVDQSQFVSIPTPAAAPHPATLEAEHTVEMLQRLVDEVPEDHFKRRQLGEAMLESGHRDAGLRELETAMVGFERSDELDAAASVADEIVRVDPESIRHHQKRVEYAFRTNERGRLIEAYLALADALFRSGQMDKSRAIYHRVIDLAPDDIRAQSALENFAETEPTPPRPQARVTGSIPRVTAPTPAPRVSKPSPLPDAEFVNLGDWLRDDDAPKDTRMVVEEKEPTGDEDADFQDMLRKFKQGISENVEEEDHQSHYDLGVAYKEMGLLDEAIAEFQKALRAPSNRVPTYEALGQCFVEKGQIPMGATILSRALHEKGVTEDQLVGVLYLLGQCAEQRGQLEQAVDYYQRVFVIDIQFKDVGERLAALESAHS